jgi:methylated-DNA-[protein]-cysteine S-methyltransferase
MRKGQVVDVSFGVVNGKAARALSVVPSTGRRATGRNPDLSSKVTDPRVQRACRTLQQYFRNARVRLDLPLSPAGTPFQQRVWRALRRIPPGQVRSYGELARSLGTSARAVGGACRANPIPILIPCHRVVSAAGEGGFMGKTAGRAMAVKRWLLRHERGR